MSAPEAPTQGCLFCKLRRKKCDRTLPSCVRCIKSGRVCPGYPDKSAIKFRDMTKISERKVLAKNAGPSFDKSLSSQIYSLHPRLSGQQDVIPRSVSTNWQQVAIPRFFADYIWQSELLKNGNFRCLLDLYNQRRTSTHFDDALQAVALMSLAKQLGNLDLSVEAGKLYGSAIRKVAIKLQNVDEAADDTIMGASFLFTVFEVISLNAVPKGFWNLNRLAHEIGRISLLRARGKQKFSTAIAANLFGMVTSHHITKCITTHVNPPEELPEWLKQASSQKFEIYNPCGPLLKCSWAIAKFCASAQALFDASEKDMQWVLRLLQVIKHGIAIEKMCQEWSDKIFRESGLWSYKVCSPRFIEAKIYHKYPAHFYHDRYVSWAWNYFRACRLRLHEVLLYCITCIQPHLHTHGLHLDPEAAGKESRSIITEMVFDMCCSTYFSLGKIDSEGGPRTQRPMPHWGYLAFWPFYIAMVSAKEGSENKSWLRENLEYITKSMGIGIGEVLARRENVDPWDIR